LGGLEALAPFEPLELFELFELLELLEPLEHLVCPTRRSTVLGALDPKATDRIEWAEADQRLVRDVAAGSTEALARLYDRHAGTVFGLARRILNRLEDAEEVVQDVFTQVWREAGRYERSRATVAGWVVMLTRTRAIDRLRSRNARPDQRSPETAPMPDIPAAAWSPEQVTISEEDVRGVRGALAELPEAQRTLVELAYYEGLTHSEIAAKTGVPLGTVKTRIRTAMATLRGVLKP
jgi:RNA polymerase sigma-70 factor (ECF subfamily)